MRDSRGIFCHWCPLERLFTNYKQAVSDVPQTSKRRTTWPHQIGEWMKTWSVSESRCSLGDDGHLVPFFGPNYTTCFCYIIGKVWFKNQWETRTDWGVCCSRNFMTPAKNETTLEGKTTCPTTDKITVCHFHNTRLVLFEMRGRLDLLWERCLGFIDMRAISQHVVKCPRKKTCRHTGCYPGTSDDYIEKKRVSLKMMRRAYEYHNDHGWADRYL